MRRRGGAKRRGGSMKGVVKTNISPTTGHRTQRVAMAASPVSVDTNSLSSPGLNTLTHQASRGLQKLKSVWRRFSCRPWFYLSLKRTIAFPGHARGDRVHLGLRPKSWTIHPEDPHPRPYRSESLDDESGNSSSCRQIVRNGYVVQFSFFGSNVSPFFQIVSATAAILRASVKRAISFRIPFASRL